MKKLIFGFVVGLSLPFIMGYIFLISGGMPVATKGSPLPLERFVARTAIHAAMKDEEDKPSPISADDVNLLAGAKVYNNHCAVCHGTFKGEPTFIAMGLFPKPPQLLDPDDAVNDDPAGEAFWKIKNGIRLTGMPGFDGHLTETEMWQVSQLLVNADKLPEPVLQALTLKTQ